ncbi:MAG: mechanosensitive ion channel protein MscS [Flavobacteriaceae bacterium]|nr:MAG: mechanosensitive ion channel protein MscS [Flavobacteriaceae bacterium]
MDTISNILHTELLHYKDHSLTVLEILVVFLLFLATKVCIWVIEKAIFSKTKLNNLDPGSAFALFQIIKYLIWVIAIALMLETIGIGVTLLLAGSAALLVGVGLGLQQTFNDVLSGIILLFENSVRVGDILEIDGDIVRIQEIGLRTSSGLNRNQIIIILPNSLITTNKVINWSHQNKKTLFTINVGVAYGSDLEQVITLLEESALAHPTLGKKDILEGRLIEFGGSSLDFQLLFYSADIFIIEEIKSDIRKIIYQKFMENKIEIPFPQMDIRLKK